MIHRSRRAGWIVFLAALSPWLATTSARAQDAVPAFNVRGPTDSTLRTTPSFALQNLGEIPAAVNAGRPADVPFWPTDSVHALMVTAARKWLARLPKNAGEGTQAESMIQLLVMAGHDSAAQRLIRERLAMPELSDANRAYTLYVAVSAFADPLEPKRFPVAEKYLAQLHALGIKGAQWCYEAEIAMAYGYQFADEPRQVARHGNAAVQLAPSLAMKDLGKLHAHAESPYMMIASATTVQPNGAAEIQAMNTILMKTTVPMADSVQLDSQFLFRADTEAQDARLLIKEVALLGTVPGPIPSNRWLNRPDTAAGDLALNDGVVHVLITADQGCPACLAQAKHLQSISVVDTMVHPVLLTWADRSIGNRTVSPDSSASNLTEFWVHHLQLHYPIALWIPNKCDTLSDGSIVMSLANDSALIRYPEASRPQGYVVDGHGRVRGSYFGAGPEIEREIVALVHTLVADEQKESAGTK